MAISWGAAGTAVSSSGSNPSLTPTAPSSSSDSFNILHIGWKSSSIAEPSVNSSTGKWIRMGVADSAADIASGLDTGSTTTLVYYSIGTAPTGTTIQFTGTVGVCQAVIVNATKAASESWVFNYTTGSDESNGANYSAAGTSNFLTVAGDLCVACSSFSTDAGSFTGTTFTATGITFGTVTSRLDSGTTTGDDMRIMCHSAPTNSGTQTDVFTLAATNASSSQGTTFTVRLRVLANPSIAIVPVNPFAETAGYQITVSGLTPYTQFKIDVLNPERTWELRGGQLQSVGADSFVGYDFEFPFGLTSAYGSQNITYTVTTFKEGQTVAIVSATTSKTPLQEWNDDLVADGIDVALGPRSYLSVPRTPALNIPIYIKEFDSYTREGRILSKSTVLMRKNPVVSTDVTSGKEGTMSLLVPNAADIIGSQYVPNNVRDHMDVLEGAHVYMLRNLSPYSVGVDDFYFVIESIAVKRINRLVDMLDTIGDPMIQIDIDWVEVDAPASSDAVSILTWQDILDTYINWQAVLDANINWLDVLQNG